MNQLDTPPDKKGAGTDKKRVGPFAHKSFEGRIDLAAGVSVEDLDLQPHGASRRFDVSQRRFGNFGIGRIDEHGNARGWNASVSPLALSRINSYRRSN